jgi:O-antigen/teichoic acid export membrane protein
MLNKNSTPERIVKNTIFLYAKMAITMFVSLYTTRLILGSLGVSDFGIFNVVGGAIAMLGFLNSAMASASMRFMAYTEGERNLLKKQQVFNISFVLHFVLAFVVAIIFIGAGYFFFNGVLNITQDRMDAAIIVYGSLIVSTMLTIMNVPYDAVMNAHENMLYYSIIGIVESLLKLGVAFACVYTVYDKLIVYGVLMACIPLITLTIMKLYCHNKYDECVIAPIRFFDKKILKDMTSFAGWNFFSSFAALVYGHGSNIVLNSFFGTNLNAANGVTGQINGQLQVFGNNLIKALNPVIVKKEGEHDREAMLKYAFTGAKMTVCMYVLFAIPFVINRDYILLLWLKTVPPYTSIFVKYIIVWTFFSQISGTLGTSIAATGMIKQYSILSSCILLLNIFLLYMAFSLGAAPDMYMILSCLAGFEQTIITVCFCKKYCDLNVRDYLYDVALRVLVGIFITYMIVYFVWSMMGMGVFRLILTCGLSFLLYSVSFYVFTLSSYEKCMIKNLFALFRSKKCIK